MEIQFEYAKDTVCCVANELARVSALCNMMSGLGDNPNNIPCDSLAATMDLLRDMLDAQYQKLTGIEWPGREARSA